jgi:3-oxoadipate enol-lactonase
MPFADTNGFRTHYVLDGRGEAPALLLSNSLGTDLWMWQAQVRWWSEKRLVLRYDTRGHGQSDAPRAPYSIESLARDARSLLDVLSLDCVDFCGLSMGGIIGMWIAAHHPERLRKLVLANTAAVIGTPDIWNSRIATVLNNGMESVAAHARSRWFTPAFIQRDESAVVATEKMIGATDAHGYAHCCEAIRDADLSNSLKNIAVPTLVISGDHDPVIPAADSEKFAAAIRGSRHIRLNASHLSNIEQPQRFTQAVLEFLGLTL